MLAILPAAAFVTYYLVSRNRNEKSLAEKLTPAGLQVLRQARRVTVFHLEQPGTEGSDSSQTLLDYPVREASAYKDSYYGMRLRKALFAVNNLTPITTTSLLQPGLAFRVTGDMPQPELVVLVSTATQQLRTAVVDAATSEVRSESRSVLSPIGRDALIFLEAEAFPASAPVGLPPNP